jgi:hypothetical protein
VIRDLNVSSWVAVRKGCPIAYCVNGQEAIEFRFGTRWDGFEFVFDLDSLLAFVEASNLAIAEFACPEPPA